MNTPHKSPMKSLFSSVFRREDIKTSKSSIPSSSSSHYRSQSCANNFTPAKNLSKTFDDYRNEPYIQETTTKETKTPIKEMNQSFQNIERNENNYVTPNAFNFEYSIEMKYEDLSRRYDRMQEFYKTQVTRLTDEVSHYKTLYHKLLIQQSAEKKIVRNNY